MASNSIPKFVELGIIGSAQAIVANTNLDGTGTLVSLVTGGLNGTLVTHVIIRYIVTTTVGMVRFFYDDLTNKRLIHEVSVSAIVPAADVPAFSAEWVPTGDLIIPSGKILKASTENGEAVNLFAIGGEY